MSSHEHPLVIPGPNAQDMLGIVSLPAPETLQQTTGVVIVVGGAQYRVGSHRQFVQLARFLAAAGYPVLRFDFPGMGDSPEEPVPFEDSAPHIAAAIDAFKGLHTRMEKVVLWGLCDGASATLLYVQATRDPRVAGLALLNPWVRSDAGLARARVTHYYRQRLLEPAFWRKLLGGQIGWHALRGLGQNVRAMHRKTPAPLGFQDAMAEGWKAFPGAILLMLSERDLSAKEFLALAQNDARWKGLLEQPRLLQQHIQGADHTCSTATASRQMESFVLSWLGRIS